jgi:formylmethanofuran dehydrogenase subunit B
LGEVKNRADLIVYWGGNPAECHPRHFTKYTLTQKGKFVPNGRKGRTMILVDIRETPSGRAADIFLQIRPTKDFEVITALRAIIKNQRVDHQLVAETGLTVEQLQDFDERM